MSSLATEFPNEQKRVRGLLQDYREIGPAGQFGVMTIQRILTQAEEAASSGNVIAMLQSWEALKGCE